MSTTQPDDRSPRATGGDVDPRSCGGDGACRSYRPGHLMHLIHAGFVGRTPWGWRDAVVREIGPDNVAVLDHLDGSGAAEIWQHHDLSVAAPPGTPVRLHERYHALAAGRAVLSVLLLRGVGPVPEPALPELWAGEGEMIVVSGATGEGRTARRG